MVRPHKIAEVKKDKNGVVTKVRFEGKAIFIDAVTAANLVINRKVEAVPIVDRVGHFQTKIGRITYTISRDEETGVAFMRNEKVYKKPLKVTPKKVSVKKAPTKKVPTKKTTKNLTTKKKASIKKAVQKKKPTRKGKDV